MFCDEFITGQDELKVVTSSLLYSRSNLFRWDGQHPGLCVQEVEYDYRYDVGYGGRPEQPNSRVRDNTWLNNLALSLNGCWVAPPLIPGQKQQRKSGFSCCKSCKKLIDNRKCLYLAIINCHYYGKAPKELTDLTREELCFVMPVCSHGFIMMYIVGVNS